MPHSELLLTLLILTGVSAGRSAPESVSLASVVLGELEDCVLVTDIRGAAIDHGLSAFGGLSLILFFSSLTRLLERDVFKFMRCPSS